VSTAAATQACNFTSCSFLKYSAPQKCGASFLSLRSTPLRSLATLNRLLRLMQAARRASWRPQPIMRKSRILRTLSSPLGLMQKKKRTGRNRCVEGYFRLKLELQFERELQLARRSRITGWETGALDYAN
jgi:hypothetical protein